MTTLFLPGFICPECIVRFPYAVKLEEHWRIFHNLSLQDNLRSYPSLRYAAKHNGKNPSSNKSSQMLHDFKTRPVNKYAPQVCHLCHEMVWNCAKVCSGCKFVCHVECQPMVLKHCLTFEMNRTQNKRQNDVSVSSSSDSQLSEQIAVNDCQLFYSEQNAVNDCELDLTYITDRLIALTFPSNGFESLYKSGLIDVLAMLRRKHGDQYRIINVSERRYDILQLHSEEQVLDCGWPDHLAPPLEKLTKIVHSIHTWMQLNKKNVAIIHCKGGKSRIGVVVAAYIQFSKNVPSAQVALEWFALGRFYDAKLDGALQPSQKRYVKYFGMIFENKLKIMNRKLCLNTIIIHGAPRFNDGSSFQFCIKVYQGYHLKHTTSTHDISSESKHLCFSTQNIQVQGDVMIKCIQKDAPINTVIFRMQFHTDAVDNCVSLFGKYDLDEAFCDQRFPDSCCVELVFCPSAEDVKNIDQGIFAMERRKEEIDKQKGNSRCYVRGPIDGSPYAQIDLKNRLRVRTAIENEETSMAIINDLDILLGDLAFTKAKYEENKKERLDKQCIEPEVGFYEIKTAPIPIKGESTLHKCCALHLPAKLQYMPSLVNGRDGFLNTNCSSNFKEFLFELDNSPLNAVSSSLVKGVKKSKYDYDGLTFDEFDFSLDNSLKETEKKEIVPGIVAQRVNLLSNVFFAENEYNRKMGIPLAGLAPTKEVIDKVTQFNSRSLASGFCSTDIDPCSRDSPRTNYNQPLIHLSGDKLLSNTYGNKYYGPDSIDVRDKSFSDDICVCDGYATILDDPLTSEIESSLKSESFPCTDSAYGESMRSSSSSPILSPLSNEEDAALNQPFTHGRESPIEMQDDSFWIQADYTSKNLLENKTFCKVNEHPSAVEVDPWYVDKSTEGSPTAASPKKEAQRKKGSLTIVEERIQPSHISQEVEHLNDEIFQHLVEFEKTMLEAGSPKTLQRMPKSNGILKPLSLKTEIMTNEYNQRTEKRPEDSPKLSLFPKSTIKRTVESDKNGVTDKSEIQPYYYNAPSNRSFERETVLSPKSPDLSGQKQPRLNGTISTKKVQCRPNGAFERTNVQHFDPSNSGDSSFESESSSSPKSTSSVVDSPQLPRFPRSISNLSAQQYVNGTLDRNRTLPYHHSVSADSAIGSECSSSPKSPDSTKFSSMRSRKYRGSGSSNSSASSAELFIEVARNPSVKFEKDTKNIWYKPNISREEAAELLRDKPPGSFIVRDSKSYIGAFGLAVKVEVLPISIIKQAGGDLSKLDMNNELVRHFLIEPCKKGVRLKGSTNEPTFSSLVALIYQHTLTKMALPITLVINDESDAVDGHNTRASTITESQLLIKGAACNLVYLGIVNVESLTGDGAVQYSMNKIIAANVNLRSTIVNIKVNQQGITFTDNNRKIFFRRHYPMEHVLHCGVDPKERLINLKTIVPDCDKEARVFGLVVRKPAKPLENECLMCAELDQDQPASAVINFIHKTMRYSQGIA